MEAKSKRIQALMPPYLHEALNKYCESTGLKEGAAVVRIVDFVLTRWDYTTEMPKLPREKKA